MKEPSGNGWKKMCFCLLFFFLAYMAGQGAAAEKNAVKTISKGHIKMAAEEENETAEEEKKEIALTFDDGPNPEYTPMLLKGLRKRNVKATFFLLGEEVEQYPDIVKEMVEDGHLLGVHSYQHVNFKEAGVEEALKQIEKTQEAIRNVTGSNCGYIRPPYGCWQKELDERENLIEVLWDVDPRDWGTKDADLVVKRILKNTKEGDIILLHDASKSSVQAAFTVIDVLKKQGYSFVTVEELLLD